MHQELQQRCERFVQNRDVIRNTLKIKDDSINLAGAALLTISHTTATEEALHRSLRIIDNYGGYLARARMDGKAGVLFKLTTVENPEEYFLALENVYQRINIGTRLDVQHKFMAAMTIEKYMGENELLRCTDRTCIIYDRFKRDKRWTTSGKDLPFAAMMAVTDLDNDTFSLEIDRCGYACKNLVRDNTARTMLKRMLALNPAPAEEKARKLQTIFDLLKTKKHKYSTGREIVVLGALTTLTLPESEIVEQIIEADDFLKTQKGFGAFSVTNEERRMYAALLALSQYEPGSPELPDRKAAELQMETCLTTILTASSMKESFH